MIKIIAPVAVILLIAALVLDRAPVKCPAANFMHGAAVKCTP